MNKTVLELLNEALGQPDAEADSSGYGFESQLNEPVNAEDSDHVMEPDNVAAIYFTEEDGEDEELLFDYESSEVVSPEASQDMFAYMGEDMIDISTMDRASDGTDLPPGEFMDEQDEFSPPGNVPVSATGGIGSEVSKIVNSPRELSPQEMSIDTSMDPEEAVKENIDFGLVELLVIESCS